MTNNTGANSLFLSFSSYFRIPMANAELPSNSTLQHDEVEEENNNDPNNNAGNMDANDSVVNEERPEDTEPERDVTVEIGNIMKLLPASDREEVRKRLEKHRSNPTREQVR